MKITKKNEGTFHLISAIIIIFFSTFILRFASALSCCTCFFVETGADPCSCRHNPQKGCSTSPLPGRTYNKSEEISEDMQKEFESRKVGDDICSIWIKKPNYYWQILRHVTKEGSGPNANFDTDKCILGPYVSPPTKTGIQKSCYCKKDWCNCEPMDAEGNPLPPTTTDDEDYGEDGLLNSSCTLFIATHLFLIALYVLFPQPI